MTRPATLAFRLAYHAETESERCAVASPAGRWSFGELHQRVTDQAQRLLAAGIGPDSIVGIDSAEDPEHLVLCLAMAHVDATSFTVPSFESPGQRERLLQRTGASFVVRPDLSIERIPDTLRRDPAVVFSQPTGAGLLFFTSGTTGDPKIVLHRDSGLVAQAHRHVGPGERFACLATMEHNFAKRHRLYCIAEGATNVFLDASKDTLVEECQRANLTTLHLSAFQAQELLGAPGVEELRGLRLKLGGSHVPASLREELRTRITDHLQCGYGTTETGAISFTHAADPPGLESVGRALPGIEIRLVDAERAAIGRGERGQIAIRCEGMFAGYLGDPVRTAASLRDGWFHTGDVGYLDEHDRLHLGGRTDDMFVFNSMNIHPHELEAQILLYPTVVDAVVLPQRSSIHGDVPVALVVHRGEGALDLRDLKSFVRERTGVRCPRRFTTVERIPRNASGKILREEARAFLHTEQDP